MDRHNNFIVIDVKGFFLLILKFILQKYVFQSVISKTNFHFKSTKKKKKNIQN